MTTHYPHFVSLVKQAGFTPTTYFISCGYGGIASS